MENTLISCKHLKKGECLLGLHDGKPHRGNCIACIKNNENNKDYAEKSIRKKEELNMSNADKFIGFGRSMAKWGKSGFQMTSDQDLSLRMGVCKSCEFWDSKGFHYTGSCKKCGCSTQAKLRMASEKCPIGKW